MDDEVYTKRWVINRRTASISRRGLFSRPQRVDARLFRVLELLLDNADSPVSHDEIIKTAWEGRVVSHDSVSTAIYQLRKILREDAKNPVNLFTIPHRGYMWQSGAEDIEPSSVQGGFLPAWSYAVLAGFCLAVLVLGMRGEQFEINDQAVTEQIFLAPVVNSTGDRKLDVSSDAVDATFVSALLRLNPGLATTRSPHISSRLTLHSEVVYRDSRPTLVLTLIDSEQELNLWSEHYDFYGEFAEPSMVEHAAKRVTEAISRI